MIWLLLGIALLALVGATLFFLARRAEKPVAAEIDLLARSEEEEFEDSVRRKQQERLRQEAERPAPAPPPDSQEEILWAESDDVYRPAPKDARQFVQSLNLSGAPAFRQKQPLVFLRRSAYEKIQRHLNSDLTIELGGLLLGPAFHDAALDAYFVLIEEALPADGGTGTAISFEYTSDTWTHITPQLQQMHPDWTVLGSYHSHPGLGVFLSTTDMDTQESVFAQEWQAALVVDPVADEIGFFFGEKGQPCPDWHLVENA